MAPKGYSGPKHQGRSFAGAFVVSASILIVAAAAPAKHTRVGTLWDEYGMSGEEGWGGTTLVWPGGFWKEDYGSENYSKSSGSYKGFLYGFRDFAVPPNDALWKTTPDYPPGTVLPYYVVQRDIKNTPDQNGFQLIPRSVKLTYRSNPSAVTTDGVANLPPELPDMPEDPILPADVRVVSYYRNNAGMRTVRTVYGFAHPAHDDYLIWHYNFTNTGQYCCPNGIVGGDSTVTYAQTLHDFHFSHSLWFMDRDESGRKTGSSGENTGDNLNNYKGHQIASPYAPEDVISDTKAVFGQKHGMNLGTATNYGDLRIQYGWDGDSPIYEGVDYGDPELVTGRMMAARWPGVALIHADTSPTDRADDPNQPQRSDYDNHMRMPRIHAANLMSGGPEFLYRTMTPNGPLVAGGLNNRFQVDAVRAGVPYGANAPNPKFTGSETIFSMGSDAWDLAPGQSINIIEVAAVGGIPYLETVELGRRARLSDAELVARGLTRLTEEERFAKYFSLEDSLFAIVRRAQNVITRTVSTLPDLDARLRTQSMSSPPNAATFDIASSASAIDMNWTAPMSRATEVVKYRVYRASVSRVGDSTWVKVYEGPSNVVSFRDESAPQNLRLHYYLVTVDASGVESSAHMARSSRWVSIGPVAIGAFAGPASATVLDHAAPNPFNASTRITYRIAVDSPVSLTIHDTNGRRVRTLVERHAPVGVFTTVWDGTDDTGRPAASGTYFVRLAAGGNVAVRRIALAR